MIDSTRRRQRARARGEHLFLERPQPPAARQVLHGIVITGQSIAVGDHSTPQLSTTPTARLAKMLIDTSTVDVNAWYGVDAVPALAPLIEPMRSFTLPDGAPAQWPVNPQGGESPASGMAAQLHATEGWRVAVIAVGHSGRSVDYLEEGGLGTAFAGMVYELDAITTLADEAGFDFVVDAILLVHGEADTRRADIQAKWKELREESEAAIKAATGQAADVPMIMSAPCGLPVDLDGGPGTSILACYYLAESEPDHYVVAPKHHFDFGPDHLHLTGWGSLRLGEQAAHVFHRYRSGLKAQLRPTSAALTSPTTARIDFEVPVPPLQFSTTTPAAHPGIAEWSAGQGFEVWNGATKIEILSAEIDGSAVVLELGAEPGAGAVIGAALWQDAIGAFYAGLEGGRVCALCDSDGFVSASAAAVACSATNGSADVTCSTPGDLAFVGPRMLAEGSGLTGAHVVSVDGDVATLSEAWAGSTGATSITFRNDHRNYAMQFELPLR